MLALAPLFAFAALVAAQADPSINTPAAVVLCQPAQISFTATKTPVFISIIPGGQPSAAPLQDLGQQNASPFTWVASIAAGTQITFQIRDSTGAVAYSAPVTIQSSSDSSCIGAGSASGSASVSASSTAAGASSASVSSASSSSAAVSSSSFEASTSSVVASVTSVASSAIASATAPATTTRASASSASTRSAASVTSASASASASPNAARSNAQVGFAGLLGLAAAVVMA